MAQGIDGHVDLAALLACLRRRALVAMVTGLHTALTTGWQRSPAEFARYPSKKYVIYRTFSTGSSGKIHLSI